MATIEFVARERNYFPAAALRPAAARGSHRVFAETPPNRRGLRCHWPSGGERGKVWPSVGREPRRTVPPGPGGSDVSGRTAALADGTTMAKGKKKLEVVHLVCEETGDQNYTLRRKTGGEKLKVKKYSPRLRKHTLHNEKRK